MQDSESYRREIRATLQGFSDQALNFQDSIIRGGIDREECDREVLQRKLRKMYPGAPLMPGENPRRLEP